MRRCFLVAGSEADILTVCAVEDLKASWIIGLGINLERASIRSSLTYMVNVCECLMC